MFTALKASVDRLISGTFKIRRTERLGHELAKRIVAGCYPSALQRTTERRRSTGYRDYLDALVQRDVRDLARIASLGALPRLLALVAELAPWHNNRLSRLIKTPKVHMGDTGFAAALLGSDAASLAADRTLLGQLLETFVFQELRRQATARDEPMTLCHFRAKDGVEVDIVIERGSSPVAGIGEGLHAVPVRALWEQS